MDIAWLSLFVVLKVTCNYENDWKTSVIRGQLKLLIAIGAAADPKQNMYKKENWLRRYDWIFLFSF